MLIQTQAHHTLNKEQTPDFETLLRPVHSSWKPYLRHALLQMPRNYLEDLLCNSDWLPGSDKLFNAFSLPLSQVKYILFGESPYPRERSANGYAFWDNAVKKLWSDKGLSKEVNRATSLRNLVKMLLIANQRLTLNDTSQNAIAKLDKSGLIETCADLFQNMQNKGILLLNACLVLSKKPVSQEARYWHPFITTLLTDLQQNSPDITLILLGNIAKQIPLSQQFSCFSAEHPYNVSFIGKPSVIEFFKPFNLLAAN